MNIKLYLAVETYELIVHDVHVFTDPDKQLAWFKETTGVSFEDYASRRDEMGSDEILGDWDQTKLFDTEVSVPIDQEPLYSILKSDVDDVLEKEEIELTVEQYNKLVKAIQDKDFSSDYEEIDMTARVIKGEEV